MHKAYSLNRTKQLGARCLISQHSTRVKKRNRVNSAPSRDPHLALIIVQTILPWLAAARGTVAFSVIVVSVFLYEALGIRLLLFSFPSDY